LVKASVSFLQFAIVDELWYQLGKLIY
jgi:hypothetical protein